MCAEPDHYKPFDAPVGPEPVAMVPESSCMHGMCPDLSSPPMLPRSERGVIVAKSQLR